jgi:hypothetical protein
MALNKAQLKTDLVAAFTFELSGTITADQSAAIDRVCGKIADAIDDYVKQGELAAGIAVTVDLGTGNGATTASAFIE